MSDNPTSRPYACPKCHKEHMKCLGHQRKNPSTPCGANPLDGQDVCKNHGGKSPQALAKASQRIEVAEIRRTADRLGIARQIDPGEALLELVWEAAGNVEFYRQLVGELPVHPEDDELSISELTGEPYWKRGAPGIYGRTYHQSGIPTGEAKRVILVQMYDDERDRLKNYVEAALKHGLEERRVRLAESDARQLFEAVGAAMTAAKLTPAQAEEFRRELANSLRNRPTQLPG